MSRQRLQELNATCAAELNLEKEEKESSCVTFRTHYALGESVTTFVSFIRWLFQTHHLCAQLCHKLNIRLLNVGLYQTFKSGVTDLVR